MVAAISSSGLGLFGSSVSALGGIGASGNGAIGQGNDRVYVNTATGNLVIQSQDELLTSLGPDLSLVRTYNSQGLLDDDNGDNWRLSVHQRLYNLTQQVNTVGSTIIKVFGDGREVTYTYDNIRGVYVSSEGSDAHDTLAFSNGTWTWTEGTSRLAETYDSSYRFTSTRDADGNTRTYTYEGALLKQIHDSSGQTTYLDYEIGNSNLSAVRVESNGVFQTLTRYGYDGSNRLISVTVDLTPTIGADAVTYLTTYTYDGGSHRVASITQGDGTSVSFTYQLVAGQYRVATYTDGEGRVTTLSYSQPTGSVGSGQSLSLNANGAALQTSRTTTHSLNSSALTTATASWTAASLLEEINDSVAASPVTAFDARGNGFAVWSQGNDVLARRYTASTASWSTAVVLDSRTNSAAVPNLAIDRQTGNAAVSWVQSDGIANSLYVNRYDASTGTWGTAQLIESAAGVVSGPDHRPSIAISGSRAVVAWRQHDGTTDSIYYARFDNGAWSAPAFVDSTTQTVMQPQAAIDQNGNAILLWREYSPADFEYRIGVRHWNNSTQSLGAATYLDGDGDRQPQVAFDAQGNAFATWGGGPQIRRFDAATGQWGPQVTLSTGTGNAWAGRLAVDAAGNALIAWAEEDGTAVSMYASRYDVVTGAWTAPALLETSNNSVYIDVAPAVSLVNGQGVVAWVQIESGQNNLYSARLSGGVWGAATLLESRTEPAQEPTAAIDAAGNATIVWVQSDGAARSIYQARHVAPNFQVPSGATWQSIANTLYGTNSAEAGAALQAALGGGALATGQLLSGMPATLSVTRTVPAYYTVRPGDTWAHITQTIYGTNNANAIAALQSVTSNPTLATGLQIDVPLSLSFVTSDSYTAPLNWNSVVTTGTQAHSLNSGALTVPNGAWQAADLLETGNAEASWPDVSFDSQGNGFAVWAQGSDVIVRRFLAASATWSAPIVLDASTEDAFAPLLSVDRATGNAVIAWVQSDGVAYSLYARVFNATTNAWSATQLIESGAGEVTPYPDGLSVSMQGNSAAVAWRQNDGTTGSIYLSRFAGGAWSMPALIDETDTAAMQPKVVVAANGTATVLWRQFADGEYHIYSRRWNSAGQSLGSITLVSGTGDRLPQIAQDAQGNVYALWRGGGTYFRRLDAATGQWSAQVQLDTGADVVGGGVISVDADGNALAAWAESDGVNYSIYARRYNAATATWGAATLVRTSLNPTAEAEIAVSISGTNGLVAWAEVIDDTATAYVARLTGSAWSAPTLLETRTESVYNLKSSMDAAGNGVVVWLQPDGGAPSIYRSYSALSPYYEVPSGATWQSIASALYGVNSLTAGNALRTILGNPPLTTGAHLRPPATLTLTVSVTPYYTVQVGDTWVGITQALYGTTAPEAISALQNALGITTLTAGVALLPPRTLSYASASGVGAASYLQTEITDESGVVMRYEQDEFGRLVAVTADPGGESVRTEYSYDGDGNVASIIEDPLGRARYTVFGYDDNGNLVSSRDSLGNTVTRHYEDDLLLSETSYVSPDPDLSGPLLPSLPLTTRYLYDGERQLRFVISPEGRVTEHQYEDGLRVLTRNFSGAAYTATEATLSQLATWANAQDPTKLERTTYDYDWRGNVSSITSYAEIGSNGANVGPASTAWFVYDQRGRLLQTIDPRGTQPGLQPAPPFSTTYTYDGLGRLQTTTQWNAASGANATTTTSTVYDDANQRIRTTFANGLIATSYFNDAGQLIRVTNGTAGATESLGTTFYYYDDAGRLRQVTDPTGVREFQFYDDAGRKLGSIDGDGTVTEYSYNDSNEVVRSIRYSEKLTATTLNALEQAPGSYTFAMLRNVVDDTPAQDQITRNVYDNAGRLLYSIDASGAVTQFIYDGASRLIETVRYTDRITVASSVIELLPTAVVVVPRNSDRHERSFYDKDGLLIGKLDGEGSLTSYQYDAAGRLVRTIAHANATTVGLRATGQYGELLASVGIDEATSESDPLEDPERDATTDYFYDAQGRLVAVHDAEGYVTRTFYDVAGQVSERVRYNAVVAHVTTRVASDLIVPNTSVRERTVYAYDGAGRVLSETVYRGTSTAESATPTSYAYDAVGRLTSTTRGSASEARTNAVIYDFLGRVIHEISAEGYAQITAGGAQPTLDDWRRWGIEYTYDNAGRRISASTRPDPITEQTNVTRYYYDNDGRLRFEVNARGERVEFRYNALNQLEHKIRYTNTISTTGLAGGLLNDQLIATLTANANPAEDSLTSYTYKLTGQVATERVSRTSNTAEDTLATYNYNAFGEVETVLDSFGVGTSYVYDQRGLLKDKTAQGIMESRGYDAFGRLTSLTDGRRNVVQRFEYDRLGRAEVSTNANPSERMVTKYDAFSRVVSVRDTLNNLTEYSYDDVNRRMTMTTGVTAERPAGIQVVTEFTVHGQTFRVTAAGNVTEYHYDHDGQLLSASDSLSNTLGALESRSYDRNGRLLTQTDANGIVTRFAYDAANRVFTRTVDNAAGGLQLVTTYEYDGQGRVWRVTDPSGRRTETEYYRDGNIEQVTVDTYGTNGANGKNLSTRYVYDREGRVLTVTEGYGATDDTGPRVTQYIYDLLGRRTFEIVDPGSEPAHLNIQTEYRYDASGNVSRKIDPRGYSTWYVYDADNRLVRSIDAMGGVTQTTYDAEGRVTATRRYATELPPTTMLWLENRDVVNLGDVTVAVTSADRWTQSVYSPEGNERFTLQAINDSEAVLTERTFDDNGRVTSERVYLQSIALTNYTTIQQVLDARPATNSMDRICWSTYDVRGRKIFSVDGLGGVVKYTYDGDGNVVATTAFATPYDTNASKSLGVLTSWTQGNASIAQDRTTRMWYDGAGRLRFTLDAEGYLTESRYLDSARQELAVVYVTEDVAIGPNATLDDVESIAQTLGNNGQLHQTTTTQYDTAGRVSRVTDILGHYEEFGYDAVGNRISFRNKNGAVWTYDYDANGRLTHEHSPLVDVWTINDEGASLTGSTSNQSLTTFILYDEMGNVLERTEAFGTGKARTTTYRYDRLGRQTETLYPAVRIYQTSGDSEWGNGGSLSRAETTDPVRTHTVVTYDALGNAFRNEFGREGSVDGQFTFKAYDRLGRVKYEVDAKNQIVEYGYDTFGNRTSVTRYDQPLSVALSKTSTSLSLSDVISRLPLPSERDRTIDTTYDRLNRISSVMQPPAWSFVPLEPSGSTSFTARATTTYQYNAFGDVRLMRETLRPGVYADTYYYYDRMGLKTAQVDAENYLTTYKYDETGDLTEQFEYAARLSQAPTLQSYTIPATTAGADRKTTFQYDRLNRKVQETKVGIAHSSVNGSGTLQEGLTDNLVTAYGYDYVGNLVRTAVNNVESFKFYDALGRVILIVDAPRPGPNGASLTPMTAMHLDAFGNLVEQIQYANTGSVTLVGDTYTYTPPSANNDAYNGDRTTRMLLDSHGNALRTEDPTGADRYASYNERGDVAKEWQFVTSYNSATQQNVTKTLVKLYRYDVLGQQTEVIEPQYFDGSSNAVTASTQVTYNAFGEIITKGVNGAQETYEYDRAGRLWRTNSGDGVVKIYLHDLAGNATAEIKAQFGGPDMRSFAYAQSVDSPSVGNVIRSETRYDKLGRVVEQRQAEFLPSGTVQAINTSFMVDRIGASRMLLWTTPPGIGETVTFNYRRWDESSWRSPPLSAQLYNNGWLEDSQLPFYNYMGVDISSLTDDLYVYEVTYTKAGASSHYAVSSGTVDLEISTTTDLGWPYTFPQVPTVPNVRMLTVPPINWNTFPTILWSAGNAYQWEVTIVSLDNGNAVTHPTPTSTASGSTLNVNNLVGLRHNIQIVGKQNGEIVLAYNGFLTTQPSTTTITLTDHTPTVAWPSVPAVSSSTEVRSQLTASITSTEEIIPVYLGRDSKGNEMWAWDWTGSNSVSFSDVGGGTHVVIEYLTRYGAATSRDVQLSGNTASWKDAYWDIATGVFTDGGITSITRARIYDANGNLVRDTAGTVSVASLTVPTISSMATADAYFQVVGTGQVITGTGLTQINGQYVLPLEAIPEGVQVDMVFEYWYSMWESQVQNYIYYPSGIGTTVRFIRNGGSVQILSQTNFLPDYATVTVSGSNLVGTLSPGDTVTMTAGNSGGAYALPIQISGNTFTASLAGLPAGQQFQYNFTISRNGVPVRAGGGLIRVQANTTQALYTIGQDGTTTTIGSFTGGYNNNILQWSPPPANGQTVEVRYTPYQGVPLTARPGGASVDLGVIPADGQYKIEVIYRDSSGKVTALGHSNVTIIRTTNVVGAFTDTTATTLASVAITPVTKQTVDRWGNVTEVRDAYQNLTQYRYNQFGQLVETTLPTAAILSTAGNVSATGAPTSGQAHTYNYYDLLGRLVATRDGNGNVNTVTYDNADQIVTEWHADGGHKDFVFNAFGNAVQVNDEEGFTTRNRYDKAGRLLAVAQERLDGHLFGDVFELNINDAEVFVQYFGYDEAGRRVSETNGMNETARYVYDLRGNVIERITPMGFSTRSEYDMQGRKIREVEPSMFYDTMWSYDYFGRLLTQTNLGVAGVEPASRNIFTYNYEWNSGLLHTQSGGGTNITYGYDMAGHLVSIDDQGSEQSSGLVNRQTEYGYDLMGRRIREKVTISGRVHQNLTTHYDALGRIDALSDLRYNLTYNYDAAGNRTRTRAVYYDNGDNLSTATPDVKDLWYGYDEMNRVVMSQGVRSASTGALVVATTQGAALDYDRRGLRTYERSAGATLFVDGFGWSYGDQVIGEKIYGYDGLGRLTHTDREIRAWINIEDAGHAGWQSDSLTYDRASRVTLRDEDSFTTEWWNFEGQPGPVPVSVPARRYQASLYDADGRVTAQLSMVGNNKESLAWFGSAAIVSGYIDILGQHIQVSGSNVGYDSNGVLWGYQTKIWDTVAVDNHELYRSQHSFNYLTGAGGRVEQTHTVNNTKITTTPGDQTPSSGSTTKRYNVNGELIKFEDANVPAANRFFANNQQGQAITAIQGNYQPTELSTMFSNALSGQGGINSTRARHSFFANGEFVGSVGQVTGHLAANFDVNYTAISNDYPATVPSTYIVQRGDTLRTVAQRVFGDANLWYVIAEANGYDSDDVALDDGIALTIPNTVVAQSNTASSFKPFNFSEVIGDTTPIQPLPPYTPKGCGIIGQIFIMVLAALVIYATWGWAAGVGNALANAATGAAVGTTTTAGAVIGGAIAGAVGSAVSQGVAIGAGLQENFNWKSLAVSAIGSGVTAGVGKYFDGLKLPDNFGTTMLAAGTSSVVTQGVSVLADLQESFSWRQVAISAVSAPLVQYVGDSVSGITGFGFLGDMAGSITGSLVRRAFDQKVDTKQMWADAFGNALASGLGASIVNQQFEHRAERLLSAAGYIGAEGDTQQSRAAVVAMLAAGGSDEQVSQIVKGQEWQRAMRRLDQVTAGGMTADAAAEHAFGFAQRSLSEVPAADPPPVSVGEDGIETVLVPATRVSPGESVLSNTIAGGVELLDTYTRFYEKHEVLATVALAGVSAALGGPTKTILKRLAGDAGDNLIERGANAFGSFVGRVVTDIATRNKWTIALSLGGFATEAKASVIGPAAGGLGSAVVETTLGAGAGQIFDRARGIVYKLKRPKNVSTKEWKGKLDAMNAQAAQGKAKIVHEPDRTGADAVQRKAHAQGMIKDGHDADHALDIQFGGSATNPANIRSTAARVNRSVGSQGKRRLDYPDGTPIREFVEDK